MSADAAGRHILSVHTLLAFEIACITLSLSDEGGTRGSHPNRIYLSKLPKDV